MLTGVIILLMLLTLLAIFLRWSNKSIIITEYRYKDAKVPEDFQGFRITQVSDLQSEYFGKEQNSLFRRVADTRPDIIVFTGDLVDRNHTDYEAGLTGMKRLCAIATVYYINGNHEMALPTEETSQFYDELRRMGVEVLFDRGTIVKKREGQIRIEISYIPRDLITVIFYYQISLNPLKTQSLSQVSFPLLFPLRYIVPPV
ncbi:MAG: metallophosphoesterase, partial [Emergencia sp.]|nr:metallophosphoesterase [Emergencia sp.]